MNLGFGDDALSQKVRVDEKEREAGLPARFDRIVLNVLSVLSFCCGVLLVFFFTVLNPVIYGYGFYGEPASFQSTLFSPANILKIIMYISCFFISGFFLWCSKTRQSATLNIAFIVFIGAIQILCFVYGVIQFFSANTMIDGEPDESNISNLANDPFYVCKFGYCGNVNPDKITDDGLRTPILFYIAYIVVIVQLVLSAIGFLIVYNQTQAGQETFSINGFLRVLDVASPLYTSSVQELTPSQSCSDPLGSKRVALRKNE